MLAHQSPATTTSHVTTTWNCLKAATAEIWPARLRFPKVLQPRSLHFFVRFQLLSLGNEVSFCWWIVGPNSPQIFRLLPKWYALQFSLWAFVSKNLIQQKSCFSISFIGIENIFAPTRITSAGVIEIKSMNSIADTPRIFPTKRLPACKSPDYRCRHSRKSWNFFFLEKTIFTKKKLLQNPSSTLKKGPQQNV